MLLYLYCGRHVRTTHGAPLHSAARPDVELPTYVGCPNKNDKNFI